MRVRFTALLFLLLLSDRLLPAQTVVPGSKASGYAAVLTPAEMRANHAFLAAKALGAPELYAFLKPMPKGGELHMHLSGAVYAETFIAEGVQEGLCVAPVDHGVPAVPEGQASLRLVPPAEGQPGSCGPGQVPVADALKRQPLYDDLIDSFSMRAFVPSEGIDGHDQFFSTFDRFAGLKEFTGEWVDEVATRAAAQNEQYLEIMHTPVFSHAAALGYKLGWPEGVNDATHFAQFARLREALLMAGLREEVAPDRKEFAAADGIRRQKEHCGESGALPACQVEVRWLYQILRGFPPQQVFAQTLLGFETAQAEMDAGEPKVVGINFVMPEDGRTAMADYHLQMLMLDYLHTVYPRVHIALHAGELAFGMVPPAGLTFHIREAVDMGHAERIGHGMDVLYEDRPNELLRDMATKHIAVEVNLTSNDVILGQTRTDHPLAAYRAAHVPVALSTDDEGVSRIDLTHEYVKAAEEQNLGYADLKRAARTALEHSFVGGQSLWAEPDEFVREVRPCAAKVAPANEPARECSTFLQSNPRAALQWELERRIAAFETGQP